MSQANIIADQNVNVDILAVPHNVSQEEYDSYWNQESAK